MLESIYHITLKLHILGNEVFGGHSSRFCHIYVTLLMTFITICKPLVFYRF